MGGVRRVCLFVAFVLILASAGGARLTQAAPVPLDDGPFIGTENTPLIIAYTDLIGNDNDTMGELIVVDTSFATAGAFGSVTYGATSLTYTPNAGFVGDDSFPYQVMSDGLTAQATVFVTIQEAPDPPNQAPIAVNDEYLTGLNQALIAPAHQGILANDIDPDGDGLTVTALNTATVPGTLQVGTDGSFSYTPPTGFEGTVQFTYAAFDGELQSNTATVSIIVQNPSTPPVANDDAYATVKNTTLLVSAPGVLGNDTDVDEQPLTAINVTGPQTLFGGAVQLNADGSFIYTPPTDFTGVDSFGYRAFDGSLTSAEAKVTISVSGPNVPPVANDDEFQTARDTALTITFAELLANDTDAEGGPLFVMENQFTTPTSGTLQVDATNDRVVYTPPTGFIGTVTFTYKVSDGESESAPATVRIFVTNVVGPTPTTGPTNPAAPTATANATPPGDDGTGGKGPSAKSPTGGGTGGGATGTTRITTLPTTGAGGDGAGWGVVVLLAGLGALAWTTVAAHWLRARRR